MRLCHLRQHSEKMGRSPARMWLGSQTFGVTTGADEKAIMQHAGSLIPPVFKCPDDKGPANAVGLDVIRKFMRRSWRLWLLWVLVFLGAAAAFLTFAPSYYTATTTLVIDERLVPQQNDNAPRLPDPAYVDTQIQVLQSSEVFTRVLTRARNGEFGALGEGTLRLAVIRIAASLDLLNVDPNALAERALVSSLKRGLLVRRVGTSNAVDISFTARDPETAARGADAFAQEYLASDVDQKQAAREEVLQSFRNRLAELQNKAFASEQPEQVATGQGANGAEARAKWREAQAAVEAYRGLYNATLQRRYAQALEQVSPAARVISAAEIQEGRSWPNAPLVALLAAFLGVACGFAHTSWRFATDDVIRTADDLVGVIGMTPIACVPEVSRRRGNRIGYEGSDPPADVFSSPQLRNAMERLAVRLCARAQKRAKTIVGVVSPQSGAGASTLAANLALALACSGHRTLLLDANWRRGQPRAKTDSLSELEIARSKLGKEDFAPDVMTLRAKGLVSEAQASRRLMQALGEVALAYDWVVVDLNPLACSADLDAIMSEVAFVMLVVAAGRTTSASLDDAATIIPGDKQVALVLNRAQRTDVPICS
jgi:Mrp family chromosome partitioning ATPase